jgi:hypothetical protein
MVTIEEAQDIISEFAETTETKPFVVGVYGLPHHGKSYFIREYAERFFDYEKFYAINSSSAPDKINENFDDAEVFFIHVAGVPEHPFNVFVTEHTLKGIKGRGIDFNVLVLNRKYHEADLEKCKELYDLVVDNPDSDSTNKITY